MTKDWSEDCVGTLMDLLQHEINLQTSKNNIHRATSGYIELSPKNTNKCNPPSSITKDNFECGDVV
jgi:hypothetical protein